jgi:hypothetical protein
VSHPAAPVFVDAFDTPAEALRVVVKDGYVYVADTYSLIVLK